MADTRIAFSGQPGDNIVVREDVATVYERLLGEHNPVQFTNEKDQPVWVKPHRIAYWQEAPSRTWTRQRSGASAG